MYCIDCGKEMVNLSNLSKTKYFFCPNCTGWGELKYSRNYGKFDNLIWIENTGKDLEYFEDYERYYIDTVHDDSVTLLGIKEFIRLAESKIEDGREGIEKRGQESFVRGLKIMFNMMIDFK